MRYLIAHATNAHWESGASPTPELIERVGGLLGGLAKEGKLLAGEGLRATSHGVRLTFEGGRSVVTPGPYGKPSAVPSGFVIVRVASLDEATGWASRLAGVLGDYFVTSFLAYKRNEVERFERYVTDWEFGEYAYHL